MNEQDRLREIAKASSDAITIIIDITKKLAEDNIFVDELSDLTYQLGYIKGMSYVPEEDDDTR